MQRGCAHERSEPHGDVGRATRCWCRERAEKFAEVWGEKKDILQVRTCPCPRPHPKLQLFLESASTSSPSMFVLALPLTAAMSSAATARAALLSAISPLERGFKADKQQRLVVESAIKALAASTSLQALPDISGDWELIYTDAPDILGLDVQAGPLATCTRIGQQISEADGEAAWSECPSSQQPTRPLTAPEPWPLALDQPLGPRGEGPRHVGAG
eukprot:scaffold38022_cov48-Phaeocystis_antarctica.AAC.2